MKNIIIFIALFLSTSVIANEAHYESNSGILFIPSAIIDGDSYYENVNILLDKSGTYSILSGNQIPMPDGPFRIKLKFDTFARLTNRTEIRFVNIVADNRCPSDVQCVTTGEATVLVYTRANNNDPVQTFSMSLSGDGIPDSEGVLVDGIYFRLLELNPYPVSDSPTPDLTEMDVVVEYSFTPFDA